MIRCFVLVVFIFLLLIRDDHAQEYDSSKIWHSYTFNNEAKTREGLKLLNFTINNFGTVKNIRKWKSLEDHKGVFLLGLGENFLQLISLNGESNLHLGKSEWNGYLSDIAVFQTWSVGSKSIENFAVVANCDNSTRSILKWYQIKDRNLVYLWDWPVNGVITHINVINFNHELKLLIISHSHSLENIASAEVYSSSVDQVLNFWLYDKFSLDDNPSTTHMSYCNDDIYLIFAFPLLEALFIYKHHKTYTDQNHFKLHHRIDSKKVSSFTSFCFGFHCYLAIASSNPSIYKFNSKSDLVQVSKTNFRGVRKWMAIQLNTFQENTLLLAQEDNYIQVVSLLGDEELQAGNSLSQMVCGQDRSCIGELRKFSAEGATSFYHDKYYYILFTSTTGDGKLLRFMVETNLLQDAVDSQLKEILQLQSMLQEKWEEQNLKMKELDKRMSMILSDREAIAPISWKLDHIKTDSVRVLMNPDGTINTFEFGHNKNWLHNDYSVYLNLKAEPVLQELEKKLNKIDSMFLNVERTATVETPKLTGLSADNAFFLGSVTVGELELSQLNGLDVEDMLENSLMFGSNRVIGGVKTVTNIKANSIYFEKLNDIPAGDIMFSDQLQDYDQKHVIHGSIVYESDITILEKLELLPNREFSPATLYPFQKEFQFMDGVTFDHLTVTEDLVVDELLNGRPIILPIHSSAFDIISSDSVNQARIEVVNVENSLNVSFINGREIFEILKDINEKLNSSSENDMHGEIKNFTTENLTISYLNGIKFPEGFITTKEGETVVIGGHKNFTGHLIVGDLLLEHGGGHVTGNANSGALNVITVEEMKVKGPLLAKKINGNTWDILGDILKHDESPVRITGTKSIKKCTFSQDVILDKLNSLRIDNIMNNFSDQVFAQTTFKDVVFEYLNVTGTLDEMNVENVKERTVRLSESKTYESTLIFDTEDEPFFSSLNVSHNVKKYENSDSGKELVIYGDVQFGEINSEIFIVNGSLMSHDKVNNINLTEFNINRLSISQPQTIRGNLSHENVTVHALDIVSVGNPETRTVQIGPESIHEMLQSRSYYVDSVLVKGNIKTLRGINGYNLTYIDENAAYIHKACFIQRKIIFEDSVSFKNLKVSGRIHGIQLKRFAQDLIFDPSYVVLRATKNFINNITVIDKMKARTLNGHPIESILTKEGDHSVESSIIINGNVRATGNVTAYGTVNGSTVIDLMNKYSSKHESYVIKGDIVLQAKEIKHLVVDGLIKNKSFSTFLKEIVTLKNDTNIVARKVIVGPVKFENNVHVEGTMNGLNITKFNRDIVLVNKDADIQGDVIMGKTIMQNLIIKNDFNSTLIHGFDTNEWLEESIPLRKSTSVNGKKIFKNIHSYNNIETDYFNGYLFSNVIPLNTEQIIPCPCHFPTMKVMSDVSVGGWVNEKNLESEFSDTVMVDEDQEIDGSLTFTRDFVVENDVTVENSDKFNVVTLHTDQTISSVIVFEGTVIANGPIVGLKYINDLNIHEWNERSVSLNKNQVIEGKWFIEGNVTVEKNILGRGLLNGESVQRSDISKNITKVKKMKNDIQTRLIFDYNRHCERISNLSNMVSRQPNIFHHFEVSQILKTSVSVESVINFRANGGDYLMLTFFDECLSILYQWNKTNGKFNFVNRMNIGPVNQWMTLDYNNTTYLITSSASDVICEKNSKSGNIWIFDGHGDKYGHLFTTDGFSDIIKSNSADGKYFTLGDNGDIYEWTLIPKISSVFVVNVGQGQQKFIEFEIFEEFAFTDRRQVKNRQGRVIHTFPKPHNGVITVAVIKGNKLVVVPYHDEIVLYENLQENKIYSSIPASNANSLVWVNSRSQLPYLLYGTEQKSVEMILVKGTHRAFEKISMPIPSHKLIFWAIPRNKGLRSREFLLVVQKKKVLLMEAFTAGNLYEGTGIQCG